MEEFLNRIPRAVALALFMFLGLRWMGVGQVYVMAGTLFVAVFFLLKILNIVTIPITILAFCWGLLALVEFVPKSGTAIAGIQHLSEQARTEIGEARKPASPLSDKLAELKTACDRNVLSPKECEDARAKIIAEFSSKP